MNKSSKTKPERPQSVPTTRDHRISDALAQVIQRHRELFRRLKDK